MPDCPDSSVNHGQVSYSRRIARPTGVTALACFFAFGAFASGLTAVLLVAPGGPLDLVWHVNERAHDGLSRLGVWGPVAMGVVSIACTASCYGFFAGRRWGFRLGVALLVINLAADLVNAGFENEPRALIGVPVVALLLWYLSSRKVRVFFSSELESARRLAALGGRAPHAIAAPRRRAPVAGEPSAAPRRD